MAVAYQNLNVTKRGYVSIANPDTHYNVSPTSSYPIRYKPADQKTYMFFGVESFPHALRRKKITEIQVTARIQQTEDSYEYPYLQICSSPSDFDAGTITWNTMPDVSKKKFIGALGSMGTSWQNVTVKSYDTGTDNLGSFIGMLHSHAFCVGNTGFSADTQNLIPAANASGSNQMIRVTYDPSVDVIGQVSILHKLLRFLSIKPVRHLNGQPSTFLGIRKPILFLQIRCQQHQRSSGNCPPQMKTAPHRPRRGASPHARRLSH